MGRLLVTAWAVLAALPLSALLAFAPRLALHPARRLGSGRHEDGVSTVAPPARRYQVPAVVCPIGAHDQRSGGLNPSHARREPGQRSSSVGLLTISSSCASGMRQRRGR